MSRHRPGALAVLAVLALAAVFTAACGEKEEPRPGIEPQQFDVALDFYVNPDHVGLYSALERG